MNGLDDHTIVDKTGDVSGDLDLARDGQHAGGGFAEVFNLLGVEAVVADHQSLAVVAAPLVGDEHDGVEFVGVDEKAELLDKLLLVSV